MFRTLLLCGGRSTRFGSDKLVAGYDWEGESLAVAQWAARNAIKGTGNALAVIRPGSAQLRQLLEREGCDILESALTDRGMGASLAAGVAHSGKTDGWIVALGDMPLISPTVFAAVLDCLRGGALIAAPVLVHTGERGHPVGFSARLREELMALDGDTGARSVVRRHAQEIQAVMVGDLGITMDVDRAEDVSYEPPHEDIGGINEA